MSSESVPELLVVFPCYNEQASVRKVISEWFSEIENWTENFTFLCLDDGSTDGTREQLDRLSLQLGSRLEVVTHANRGHGQTCLEGYRTAAQRKIRFILQIDSDGQCDPQYFFKFWRVRDDYDVIYGQRTRRDDGLRRVFASAVLRIVLLLFTRTSCRDSNVPYRLMRTSSISEDLAKIPSDFYLANIGLAVLLSRNPLIRTFWIPIRFRERYGGEPSVRFSAFGSRASELVAQLRHLTAK